MLEVPARPPESPGRAPSLLPQGAGPPRPPGPDGPFVVRLEGFEGNLLELAAALRAGRVAPAAVPLLELTREALARFHTLRGSDAGLDAASEALPHLAAVIELKARLLLPRPPKAEAAEEDEAERPLSEVLEGVEALARLEGAIEFLRDRRRERARLLPAGPAPVELPRRVRPLGKELGDLVAAARRRVREVNVFDLALDRLSLPQALARLRAQARRLGRFLFREVPAESWGERTVLFAALLEGVKAGELEASQAEPYGEIEVEATGRNESRLEPNVT